MKFVSYFEFILFIFFTNNLSGFSHESQTGINIYMDCEDCDMTFIRQELTFVSFTRDPLLSDVHILVTDSNTGSGGQKYFLNFIGQGEFTGVNNDYTVITNQAATNDDIRRTLLKTIKVGILQYYSKSGFIERLNINLEDNEHKKS